MVVTKYACPLTNAICMVHMLSSAQLLVAQMFKQSARSTPVPCA